MYLLTFGFVFVSTPQVIHEIFSIGSKQVRGSGRDIKHSEEQSSPQFTFDS